MRSTMTVRAAKTGYIALSSVLCGLGLLLILKPDLSMALTGAFIGAVMIAFGVIKLVGYFSKDLYRLAFQFDLALGILLIALGALLLAKPVRLMSMLCVILGIEIVADSLFKVQTAVDARRFGLETWWLIMALALLTGGAGVAVAVNPSNSALTLTVFIGAALLVEGLMNLCVALCTVKIVKHQRPDIIETDFMGEER